MAARRYRITVRGRLSDRFASAFPDMALEAAEGRTVLAGEVTDQAQLYGLLGLLRDLGLELVSLREVE